MLSLLDVHSKDLTERLYINPCIIIASFADSVDRVLCTILLDFDSFAIALSPRFLRRDPHL